MWVGKTQSTMVLNAVQFGQISGLTRKATKFEYQAMKDKNRCGHDLACAYGCVEHVVAFEQNSMCRKNVFSATFKHM